jgi:hypothetical protein
MSSAEISDQLLTFSSIKAAANWPFERKRRRCSPLTSARAAITGSAPRSGVLNWTRYVVSIISITNSLGHAPSIGVTIVLVNAWTAAPLTRPHSQENSLISRYRRPSCDVAGEALAISCNRADCNADIELDIGKAAAVQRHLSETLTGAP